jgi:putative phosphoesterase
MKTAIIFSDTHGNTAVIKKLDEILRETDYIFHLGDYARDFLFVKEKYPNKAKSVPGNCDGLFGDGIIDIDGVKVFYTHGHDYGVKSDLTKLYFKAKSLGVNVVLFGHTHEKLILEKDGILFINPGSVRDCLTYAYLVISNKKAYAKIVDIY